MASALSRRISSIDTLRGLSMCLMIMSSAIASNSGLPAWMFHCQVPPSDFAFHPEIRGITWVDLVFPFFLFSMGAAFPFALGKRLKRGESRMRIVLVLLRRWVTLVLFALALGNSGAIFGYDGPAAVPVLFRLAVWGGFFLSLLRTESKWVNPCGYALLAALFAAEYFVFGVELSVWQNDIIIMILSAVALTGGLIWLLSAGNIRLRMLIWLAILAIKALSSYTGCLEWLALPSAASWLINWSFLQYLILVIPASVVGDMLAGQDSGRAAPADLRSAVGAMVAFAAVIVQLWGLYTRNVSADLCISAALAAVYAALSARRDGKKTLIGYMGFALLIAGVAFDFADGGIAKDHCNISYLLTTCGMSALMTSVFLEAEARGCNGGFLSLCGQNPMFAYTICWFVISPALYACGLMDTVDGLCEGNVFWGVTRGLVMVALMCVTTALASRFRIFWRS